MTESTENTRTFILPNDVSHLKEARDFIKGALDESGLDPKVHNHVVLAIDEAVTNIIEHAYEEGRLDRIELVTTTSSTRFEIVIRDYGQAFDPSGIQDPDLQQYIKDRKKGGLGIFLIRKIMDEVEYTFKEGRKNELRLVKYAKPPEA